MGVRWGIMGCGAIAARMAQVINGMPDCELHAVAARDIARAENFAHQFKANTAYGSYAQLAEDPEVDAVYVATIHPTHAKCIRLCLNAGKSVLCEKPLCMTGAEAKELYALAADKGLLLLEGMWTRFLPAWREVRSLIENDALGEIGLVQADLSVLIPFDPDSRIYDLKKGGGALLDIGVYAVHAVMQILGPDYISLKAVGRFTPTGSDGAAAMIFLYSNGALGVVTCGCDSSGSGGVEIYGKTGHISIPQFIGAKEYTLFKNGCEPKRQAFEDIDGFYYEVEEFIKRMELGEIYSPLNTPQDSITAMSVLDESLRQLQEIVGAGREN